MKPDQDVASTARMISQRLFLLVFRALGGMLVVLLVLLVLAVWGILRWVKSSPESVAPLLVYMLESHYEARGNWDGVQSVFVTNSSPTIAENQQGWDETILLDQEDRVLIANGRADSPLVGQSYSLSGSDLSLSLQVKNQVVGRLIFRFNPLQVFLPIMQPFIMIAILLGVLALFIALLLVGRLVRPLAEVIAAARLVSAGNLAARVKTRGPSDLRVLSDSFNQMAESLERNDREQRELLAIIAHELRTPLSVLRGRLEGIVDGIYPADEAHIAGALEETYLLGRLVEDLRLLALAEARQLHFDRKPVDLADLARRAVELFEAEAGEKQIQLKLVAESGLPLVDADPQRMEQAIGNLIGNALRYIPLGGLVEVSVQQAVQNQIEVSVSDNGPGVAPEDLPLIFDRFWRSDSARTRESGGSGLGLAIAKELIEAQGGKIIARNLPEGGLQVVISFGVPPQ